MSAHTPLLKRRWLNSFTRILVLLTLTLTGLSLGSLVTPHVMWAEQSQAPQALQAQRTPHELQPLLIEAGRRVEERLGLSPPAHFEVKLLDSAREMKRAAHEAHGWAPPEWANGLAYPREGVIYLHQDAPQELARTLTHELAHLALAPQPSPSGSVGAQLPLWLNEGLAVWASEPVSFERMKTLTEARLSGRLLPFQRLMRAFPASPSHAQLAYAQSVHFVTYLADTHGAPALRRFTRALLAGTSLDEASEQAFERSFRGLEGAWRTSLTHSPWASLTLLAQEGVALALALSLAFLIALFHAVKRSFSHKGRERESSPALGFPPKLAGLRVASQNTPQPTPPSQSP
jgi:hypothetical protein